MDTHNALYCTEGDQSRGCSSLFFVAAHALSVRIVYTRQTTADDCQPTAVSNVIHGIINLARRAIRPSDGARAEQKATAIKRRRLLLQRRYIGATETRARALPPPSYTPFVEFSWPAAGIPRR